MFKNFTKKQIMIGVTVTVLMLISSFFLGGRVNNKSAVSGFNDKIKPQSDDISYSDSVPNDEISQSENKSVKPDDENKTDNTDNVVSNVPEEKPKQDTPPTVSDQVSEEEKNICTFSISCATILNNMDMISDNKKTLIPPNGVVLSVADIEFTEGESVFDVMKRELIKNGIHMEFSSTPMNGSVYIEGINNIYELDCGPLSGWMCKVNGVSLNYGCNMYELTSGDVIEWVYTCDLGADVGGSFYR